MALDAAFVQTQIRHFIEAELLKGKSGLEFENDTDLLKTGIIDSINVLGLVAYVEDEYEIELGPSDVQNFTSVSNITGVIGSLQAA